MLILANRKFILDIIANDQVSSVLNNIKSNASSFSSTLIKTLSGSVNAFGNLNSALRTYNNSMYNFNRVATSTLRVVGDSIYSFTKDAINNFSELERQHAKTIGAMATDYEKTAVAQAKFLEDSKKLQQQAINLGTNGIGGRGSLYTPLDISYAQTALYKSGLSSDKILNSGALESILKFAGGNDLSIDTATQFAVNLGTVFNKPVEEWGNMLDMVTKAADISVIDVEDIMDSLTYTGGIASGLGRDLGEVLGVISVMGQAGLRGRVAGTGLQAFFTRILSAGELSDTAIGNAPTEYVGQMYNAFSAEAVNPDGSFKDMDEVASLLDTAMSTLNDQEQAWFAKKLFGLYQMKAAYAISGAVDGNTNLITDFIDQIENQSSGTNDEKLDKMLESQYGKIARLQNRWQGTKTDVGARLSPITTTMVDELFNFLGDPGNYNIDLDSLRDAVSESGELIGEKYGEELQKAVEDLGNFGIDAGQIMGAMTPYAGGLISGIGKLLNGDISGAIDEFYQGLEDTNSEIEELPPELQGTAEKARDVIRMFTDLAGFNITTKLLEMLTAPVALVKKKLLGNTKVNSTSSTVTIGTATAVNIGQVPLMNVTATVVNVYGGGGNNNPNTNPTNPTTPLLPSGPSTPLLPSGGNGWLLPAAAAAAGAGAYAAGNAALAAGSSSIPLLTTGAAATGETVATYYLVNGMQMTAKEIITAMAKSAVKKFGLAGLAIATAELTASPGLLESKGQRMSGGSDWIDRFVLEYAQGERDEPYGTNSYTYYWQKNHPNYNGENGDELLMAEGYGRAAAREEMMSYYKSETGANMLHDLFMTQIEENGKITEEFLTILTTWTKDGYTYAGSEGDIKEILEFMYTNFGTDFKEDSGYFDRFNNAAIDEFLKNNPMFGIASGAGSIFDTALNNSDKVSSNSLAPIINVNVTTNVDKSGNATTKVNIDGISRDTARRAARYGETQAYMMN